MDQERTPPAGKMLPPFRVKQIQALPEVDGVIRMKKDEYDGLVQKQPQAALNYIDDNDGELITVGSAFELDQKLAEPVARAARTIAGVPLDLYATGRTPMHTFEIKKDKEVVETWTALNRRTAEEGQRAKKVFFGRQIPVMSSTSKPSETVHGASTSTKPATSPSLKTRSDYAAHFGFKFPQPTNPNSTEHGSQETSPAVRLDPYRALAVALDPVLIREAQHHIPTDKLPQPSKDEREPITHGLVEPSLLDPDTLHPDPVLGATSNLIEADLYVPAVPRTSADIRFGQATPPRSSLVTLNHNNDSSPHAVRWAAYGKASGSLNPPIPGPEKPEQVIKPSPTLDEESQRVETAVEKMRLCLLQTPDWTPAKVYTRADILEEFFNRYKKMQDSGVVDKAEISRELGETDETGQPGPGQAQPPTPPPRPTQYSTTQSHNVHVLAHPNIGHPGNRASMFEHPSQLMAVAQQAIDDSYNQRSTLLRRMPSAPTSSWRSNAPNMRPARSTGVLRAPSGRDRYLTKVDRCARRLAEMGFDRSRAMTVAEAVMGDVESAVDMLHEDEAARQTERL